MGTCVMRPWLARTAPHLSRDREEWYRDRDSATWAALLVTVSGQRWPDWTEKMILFYVDIRYIYCLWLFYLLF